MNQINSNDFSKIEITIGTILSAQRVPETDKLIKLFVDVGEESPRQIISGVAEYVSPLELVGKQCPFVTNLQPRVIKELESNSMILALGEGETFALLHPHKHVPPGTKGH